jgi:glyoxylase-like metal-dependent hydrolase (beta-lactamase superfamily II)/predicted negative regulator of RcsB-dependent stress response
LISVLLLFLLAVLISFGSTIGEKHSHLMDFENFTAVFNDPDSIPLKVNRYSERVLILTEESPMENNIVAIKTKKGIAVIDATGSPITASGVRKKIAEVFGTDKFAYLINTHQHWDHAYGNQIFKDAIIIGHENCYNSMKNDVKNVPDIIKNFNRSLTLSKSNADKAEKGSEEYIKNQQEIGFYERVCKGLGTNFTPAFQNITFNDQMTINLDDITLNLVFFGRAHSGSDIFVHIPEEGILLTGDIFLDKGWLPLFSGQTELDIPRWIDVLQTLLDEEKKIKDVIPGHREIWPKEKLTLWSDYIVGLWETVKSAKSSGLKSEDIFTKYPLGEKYNYLKKLGHTDESLSNFHKRNITAFWRQLFQLASVEIEKIIKEKGIDEAVKAYSSMKADKKTEYSFDEGSFFNLGWKFIEQEKFKEAISVFKMIQQDNVKSANAYYYIGEAYRRSGNKQSAIENYEKSYQLNPKNIFVKDKLEELKNNK